MADRGHSSYFPGARRPAGIGVGPLPPILGADTEQAEYRDSEPCHVEVRTDRGWAPGLLSQWCKPRGFLWQGRVVYGDVKDGRWVVVDEWVPSTLLRTVET